jgi:hypothetical protein
MESNWGTFWVMTVVFCVSICSARLTLSESYVAALENPIKEALQETK